MVKIYILRHGHSTGNEQNLITGHYDCDLSEMGKRQASLAADYIFKNLKIDVFYSTDLIRAKNTLLPAAKLCGKPIVIEPALRELSVGEWEGRSFEEIEGLYPREFRAWVNKEDGAVPTGGESWEEMSRRVVHRFREILEESEGKSIIICTHGGVIKALQCHFANKPIRYMADIEWVSNASISEIWYENGKYETKTVSYDDYLDDLKTHLPKTV